MSETNRHRKPTGTQLVRRIYRRQLRNEKLILELKAEVSRLTTRAEISAAIAAHCRRLLAEKATMLKVIEANRFMSAALPRRPA
jgi:hypothetical protein